MDAIDVRRSANNEVMSLMQRTGISSKAARGIIKDDVMNRYRTAVEYGEVAAGFEKAWMSGWRKGLGF